MKNGETISHPKKSSFPLKFGRFWSQKLLRITNVHAEFINGSNDKFSTFFNTPQKPAEECRQSRQG